MDVLHYAQYESTIPKGCSLFITITTGPVLRQSGLIYQLSQQRYEHIDGKSVLWKRPHFLQQTRFPVPAQLLFKCKAVSAGGVDQILYWDETGDGEKE